MEELRKAMTDKMLEAMRKNVGNTARYLRSKIDEGNFPLISIINERYSDNFNNALDSNKIVKINHDYIVFNDYFTMMTSISMAMKDKNIISDQEIIILDGAARYLEIYYKRLMLMPTFRSRIESIFDIIKCILDTDYYLFSDSQLVCSMSATLDETCNMIREKYTIAHENVRERYIKHTKFINKLALFKNASSIGVVPSSLRDYLPDYPFVEIIPLMNQDNYGKMPQYVIKVNNDEMYKTFMQKTKADTITTNDLYLVQYLYDYYINSVRLGFSPLSLSDDSEYIDVSVTMKMTVKRNGYDELKRIENHVESLLDLDNWSEIKSVRDVHVDRIEDCSELSFNTNYFDEESELAMRAMIDIFNPKTATEKIDDEDPAIESDIPTESKN